MLNMIKSFDDLPHWTFDIEEVSLGVYEVIAKDSNGRLITMKGFDPELLLEQCRIRALACDS